VKYLISGFRLQNLNGRIMTIRGLVWQFHIRYCYFWELLSRNGAFAKLADEVREGVQKMELHTVEIQVVHKMLCNFGLNLCLIFIKSITLCNCSRIIPSGGYTLISTVRPIQAAFQYF
jgi:hypothetical protein